MNSFRWRLWCPLPSVNSVCWRLQRTVPRVRLDCAHNPCVCNQFLRPTHFLNVWPALAAGSMHTPKQCRPILEAFSSCWSPLNIGANCNFSTFRATTPLLHPNSTWLREPTSVNLRCSSAPRGSNNYCKERNRDTRTLLGLPRTTTGQRTLQQQQGLGLGTHNLPPLNLRRSSGLTDL